MVRLDTLKPWSVTNVDIRNRRDWLREINLNNEHRLGFRKFDKA